MQCEPLLDFTCLNTTITVSLLTTTIILVAVCVHDGKFFVPLIEVGSLVALVRYNLRLSDL